MRAAVKDNVRITGDPFSASGSVPLAVLHKGLRRGFAGHAPGTGILADAAGHGGLQAQICAERFAPCQNAIRRGGALALRLVRDSPGHITLLSMLALRRVARPQAR